MDLNLWLDKQLLERQNRLRQEFWDILGEAGNAIAPSRLLQIHPKSQGIKLSRGNELNGFPYQVLDLIRDFDEHTGMNIRLLNWFGHGFFLFLLIGKDHPLAPLDFLLQNGWSLSVIPDQWDYRAIVRPAGRTTQISDLHTIQLPIIQWVKSLHLEGIRETVQGQIDSELNKIIDLLAQKMG